MDNLCHSLAGAAIAHAARGPRLPRAVLLGVVAANIPDVDAFVYLFGESASAVAFRRGATHGIPALMVWSLVLPTLFAWLQRVRPLGSEQARVHWRQYLPIAALAVVSHPALDWLNTYGVRFLAPFSDRWFYGDAVFIVDPVMLAVLGTGVIGSAWAAGRGRPWASRPALAALVVVFAYAAGMKSASAMTRREVVAKLGIAEPAPRDLMVAPMPLAWGRHDIVVRRPPTYDRYMATWVGGRPEVSERRWRDPIGDDSTVVARVRETADGRRFLRWSRFPYFVAGDVADSAFVGDLRYSVGTVESWAGLWIDTNGSGRARE